MSIELLVAVPILMLCVVAIVQFGLELAGAVVIHQSAVLGAGRCSTIGRVIWSDLDDSTAAAVQLQLTAVNITFTAATDVQVIVQERVFDPATSYTGTSGTWPLGATFAAAPAASSIPADSVRVTVNVRLARVIPDLLSGFGFSITGDYITASVIRPYNG
jgi:ABC-type sulfate transport system permease component